MVVILLVVGLGRTPSASVHADHERIACLGWAPLCIVYEIHGAIFDFERPALKHLHFGCRVSLLEVIPQLIVVCLRVHLK